jgi:hypothetical protein
MIWRLLPTQIMVEIYYNVFSCSADGSSENIRLDGSFKIIGNTFIRIKNEKLYLNDGDFIFTTESLKNDIIGAIQYEKYTDVGSYSIGVHISAGALTGLLSSLRPPRVLRARLTLGTTDGLSLDTPEPIWDRENFIPITAYEAWTMDPEK